MKIIFLGTNGWYSSPTGNTECILIESKSHYIIFDAGSGFYKIDNYITQDKPIALFISHFHIDHISGFHTLGKFKFQQGIDIYFAKGRKKDFQTFVHPPFTIGIENKKENILNLSYPIRLHELEIGNHEVGFPIEILKMKHGYEDHGYRIAMEDKIISYSGDTGICPTSKQLARNADVLIHECSFIDDSDDEWGHVGPGQVASLANESGVKKLVLTHFDASRYDTLEKRMNAQKIAREIFPNTIAAIDDMILLV